MTTEICYECGEECKYSEKYDANYCPKCLIWMEIICSDRECEFCKNRPKYPEVNQE